MPNLDSDGRDLGDAVPIGVPDAIANLRVEHGDDQGRADAIKKIRAAMGTQVKPAQVTQPVENAQEATIQDGDQDEPEMVEATPTSVDAQELRRLSANDLDELVLEINGEELVLSKEELLKGAGLYDANNKKSRELAEDKKALDAERAKVTALASQEVNDLAQEIEVRETRNSHIDELLEYAYRNNYAAVKFKDGTIVQVTQLENERKANELAIRRASQQASEKQLKIEQALESYQSEQIAFLKKKDPEILNRLDDIASYLKQVGFSSEQANYLVRSSAAPLVIALDKARKFDNSLNSTPEKKKSSQTKMISRSTGRSERVGQPNSNIAKWQEVVKSAPVGSTQYREGLKQLRMAQMRN